MMKLNTLRKLAIAAWSVVGLIWGAALSADEYTNLFTPMWLGNPPKEETAGKGWRQSGLLQKTFDVADRQIAQILRDHGFVEKNHTEKTKDMKKSKISLWSRNRQQIIVMLMEQGIGETLFSWGVVTHGN